MQTWEVMEWGERVLLGKSYSKRRNFGEHVLLNKSYGKRHSLGV